MTCCNSAVPHHYRLGIILRFMTAVDSAVWMENTAHAQPFRTPHFQIEKGCFSVSYFHLCCGPRLGKCQGSVYQKIVFTLPDANVWF